MRLVELLSCKQQDGRGGQHTHDGDCGQGQLRSRKAHHTRVVLVFLALNASLLLFLS